jgi:uncharacterized Zn finger protein
MSSTTINLHIDSLIGKLEVPAVVYGSEANLNITSIKASVTDALINALNEAKIDKYPAITRELARSIAVECAKSANPSYYSEPFEPHDWVIDAMMQFKNS